MSTPVQRRCLNQLVGRTDHSADDRIMLKKLAGPEFMQMLAESSLEMREK